VTGYFHFLCSPKENETKEKAPSSRHFFDTEVEKPRPKLCVVPQGTPDLRAFGLYAANKDFGCAAFDIFLNFY